MKRIFCVLVGMVCFLGWNLPEAHALHALTEGVTYEFAPSFALRGYVGMLEGEALEIVYDPEEGGRKISELQWDLSGLTIAGLGISVNWGRWRFNAGAWTAVNEGDGEMKDYDWLIPGMDWSDYSRSEVDIEKSYLVDMNITYAFHTTPFIEVRGVVGYKEDFWEWSDRGQEFVYSLYGFRDYTGHFGGENVIDYEQRFQIPYLGIQLAGATGRARWLAYGAYSPFVQAEDKDHHILRETHFEEKFSGGDYFAAGLGVAWSLTRLAEIGLTLEYQEVPTFKGDMTIVELGEKIKNNAGIANSHSAAMVTLGIRF